MPTNALDQPPTARGSWRIALALALVAILGSSAVALAANGRCNSAATITASFSDSCRDFTARSSKDISHVVLAYADGRVVKDERIYSRHYSIDGAVGDEIEYAIVKSGTTRKRFECETPPVNRPPTALLEIETPDDSACGLFWESGLQCVQWAPRSVWRSEFPTEPGSSNSQEAGNLLWLCDQAFACSFTFDLRATGSSDPDDDIASWSIDFGDGASVSGSWSADPPANVAHTYGSGPFSSCADEFHVCPTLTVTDTAGQSDTDTITMAFIDVTPD